MFARASETMWTHNFHIVDSESNAVGVQERLWDSLNLWAGRLSCKAFDFKVRGSRICMSIANISKIISEDFIESISA